METNDTRKEKYSKMILRDKKITKKKKPNKEQKIKKIKLKIMKKNPT